VSRSVLRSIGGDGHEVKDARTAAGADLTIAGMLAFETHGAVPQARHDDAGEIVAAVLAAAVRARQHEEGWRIGDDDAAGMADSAGGAGPALVDFEAQAQKPWNFLNQSWGCIFAPASLDGAFSSF